jgi:hypothetical protein
MAHMTRKAKKTSTGRAKLIENASKAIKEPNGPVQEW